MRAMVDLLVQSRESFQKWLKDKPPEWAQMITIRGTLRSLPILANSSGSWKQNYLLPSIRIAFLTWACCGAKSETVFLGLETAASVRPPASNISRQAVNALRAILAAGDALLNSQRLLGFAPLAIANATAALDNRYSGQLHPSLWRDINADCNWLVGWGAANPKSSLLITQPLWLDGPARSWTEIWKQLSNSLTNESKATSVWIEWFERRIAGEASAFDIPGDNSRVEDSIIIDRLAAATDDAFWGKGHEYVNATLKGWLDEARERAAGNLETRTSLGAIKPDPQDSRSPQFGNDATGRIAIKGDAGANQLRSDPQSVSRHARALQMAQKLGEALRNHNNAGYITAMVDDYVAPMGRDPEGADPSGLVFAGDQLRDVIAKHRAARPNDDLQPLPPSADRDASAFLSAHNMYVGSDPFLDDLDRTTRGPDAPLPAANPSEIRHIAAIARQDDILAEPTYDYMISASNAAPAIYDKEDRHSRFAAGLAQNFARYGIEFLWAYPSEAAWAGLIAGVGVTMTLGPLAAAGGTVAGIGVAYHLARNMIANEAIYRKLLATSPAGEDNFSRLMRFLKALPVKSLKDE
jgi:hypothetical protein